MLYPLLHLPCILLQSFFYQCFSFCGLPTVKVTEPESHVILRHQIEVIYSGNNVYTLLNHSVTHIKPYISRRVLGHHRLKKFLNGQLHSIRLCQLGNMQLFKRFKLEWRSRVEICLCAVMSWLPPIPI